ncbi:MAG: HPF/RaiA family ribosome-associated protein [Patescibacteria group bacterium]|nr:HPF/RaiA family ribosome-associated protein [Patescibacteria group bacterium]
MQVNPVHKSLDEAEKQEFDDYLEKKIPRIEKLLTHFAQDAVLLTAVIEKFEKHSAFKVEFKLEIPSSMLVAGESSHAITKAIDLTIDRLVAQLKKHLEKLNNKV